VTWFQEEPRFDDYDRDRGSATIWVVVLCVTVWSSALAAATMGAALVARHRAESAADLAALAAARSVLRGDPDSCGPARRVADAAGARVVGCEPESDGSVLVVVHVPVAGPVARWADAPPARARARAGGVWSVGEGG
jgi:secretion/DNA translocation related TadE-like protein